MYHRRERRVVVQVVNSLARAGAERVAVDLARRLDPLVWDVHIVVVRDGELREYVEDAGLVLYKTGHGFNHTAVFAVLKMTVYFRRVRPDVVHTHLLGSDIVGRIAALLAGVPIIVSTQHDMLPRPWPYTLFKRLTGRMIAATVACSSQVAGYCADVMRIPSRRLRQIDNGVDVEVFTEAVHPVGVPPTFGAMGSLIPVKGHVFLLEAFARVVRDIPGARLLIAGAGTERPALERRIEELGIADSVELRGLVGDVPGFLGEVDIFVHPSLSEGMPMALLEAEAAARPCITSEVSVLPELVGSPDTGVCVPPGDPDALAEAMTRLAHDPEQATRMGLGARDRVSQRYSLQRSVNEYARLYGDLLAQAGLKGSAGVPPLEPRWWRMGRRGLQVGVLGVVGIFVARALSRGFAEAAFEGIHIHPGAMAASAALLGLYYLLFTGGLTLLLRANGHRAAFRDVFKVSFVANLGKYLPGGLWPIAGRVTLASRLRISQQTAVVMSVVESAVSVAGGLLLISFAQLTVTDIVGVPSQLLVLGMVAMLLLGLHPRIFSRLITAVSGLLRAKAVPSGMSYPVTLGIVLYYSMTWLVAGAAFRAMVIALNGVAGGGVLAYSAYYAFGAITGLLVLFAPGGIGAREGALLLVLSGPLGAPVAAVVSLMARLWSTIIELVMSAVALVMPYSRDARSSGSRETPA